MKIFNVDQIQNWDSFTILNENISGIELMERAASAFVETFLHHIDFATVGTLHIFCGSGNNGGDGLAIARLLSYFPFKGIRVYHVMISKSCSADFHVNYSRLALIENVKIFSLEDLAFFPDISVNDTIIDAIFGTGLRANVTGFAREIIIKINACQAKIWSVDLPSGLQVDKPTSSISIEANHTVTFESPKLAFFIPDNFIRIGEWQIASINLSESFYQFEPTKYNYINKKEILQLYKRRERNANKWTCGHSLIIAGSSGKIGAAVLATRACMRGGSGLVTALVPEHGSSVLQIAAPEAMLVSDENGLETGHLPMLAKYNAIAIGPGIGTSENSLSVLGYSGDADPHSGDTDPPE
ncbi:MAG: NAD(P)H-hydrate epimerase, partial [Saprospiraceae bacterium]